MDISYHPEIQYRNQSHAWHHKPSSPEFPFKKGGQGNREGAVSQTREKRGNARPKAGLSWPRKGASHISSCLNMIDRRPICCPLVSVGEKRFLQPLKAQFGRRGWAVPMRRTRRQESLKRPHETQRSEWNLSRATFSFSDLPYDLVRNSCPSRILVSPSLQ